MNAAVALKIGGHGLVADLPHCKVAGERFVELEFAEIGGENQCSTLGQVLHGQAEQGRVILLDIKGLIAVTGIGKGGRIDKDHPESLVIAFEPIDAIGLDGLMQRPAETVERQVGLGPGEIGFGDVDRGGGGGPAHGGIDRGGPGVGEQVEKGLALGQLPQAGPGDPVVEEQAGVQIIGEIDQKTAAALMHLVQGAGSRLFLVLLRSFLFLPGFDEDPAARGIENRADHLQGQAESLLCFFLINGGRRRVFLDMDPLLVQINRQIVFRDIAVVDAKTGNPLLFCPREEGSAVFDQPVGEILAGAAGFQGNQRPGMRWLFRSI